MPESAVATSPELNTGSPSGVTLKEPSLRLMRIRWVAQYASCSSTGASIGTSLIVIIPTAITGAFKHQQLGNIDWKMAASLVPLAIVGGFIGAALTKPLPADTLKKLFGGFMILAGCRLLFFK